MHEGVTRQTRFQLVDIVSGSHDTFAEPLLIASLALGEDQI